MWFALYLIFGVIVIYMLFFADLSEGAITQGVLMDGATVVITVLILLLMFFDHPHGNGLGTLQSTAMQRSLRLINAEMGVAGLDLTNGSVYVLQSASLNVDPTMSLVKLPTLRDTLQLPDGRQHRTPTLDQDLVVVAQRGSPPAHIVFDEFENNYQRIDT